MKTLVFSLSLALASCAPAESLPPPAEPLPDPALAAADKDPFAGTFTLDDATKGMTGKGALLATIETNLGSMQCTLFDDRAPVSVANFVGLARGTRPWRDPETRHWAARPAYDGTSFHRIVRGFMIQGGDPLGTGDGQPGYVIKDEIWEGAKHDRAGLLCMANRGPNTNGIQFFVTDAAAPHLDGRYTIFGECTPLATVHAIAGVKVVRSHPTEEVVITRVTIARETP